MTKSAINKTWIAGLAVLAAGMIVVGVGVFLMLMYGGTFSQVAGTNSYEFVPTIDSYFWTTVAVIAAGGCVAALGGIVQLVAWIGALANSYRLPDKAWFLILLLGGILSLGFAPLGIAVMIAYVVAAPDGSVYHRLETPGVPKPTALAPTS